MKKNLKYPSSLLSCRTWTATGNTEICLGFSCAMAADLLNIVFMTLLIQFFSSFVSHCSVIIMCYSKQIFMQFVKICILRAQYESPAKTTNLILEVNCHVLNSRVAQQPTRLVILNTFIGLYLYACFLTLEQIGLYILLKVIIASLVLC